VGRTSTFLLQIGGLNVLTDPIVGRSGASPVSFAGPRRHAAPGIALDALPPVDVVLQSARPLRPSGRTRRCGPIARAHPDAQWFRAARRRPRG